MGEAALLFPDPFDAEDPKSFYRWLQEPAYSDGPNQVPAISRLWRALYERHPDLQARFPDLANADRAAFVDWAESRGKERFVLPDEFALTRSR